MRRFILARARQTAIVAFVVTTLAFLLVHLAPGDPLAASPDDSPEVAVAREQLRVAYALDRPLAVQYPLMLANFARGNFGDSFTKAMPVRTVLADVIPRTLVLMVPALIVGVIAGAALGTMQGVYAGRWFDRVTGIGALTVLSVPEFLLALLASVVFAVRLGWLPGTGMLSADLDPMSGAAARAADLARHLILPGGTLALVVAALVSRFQRAAVADALQEEFVRAVRAKGLAVRRVVAHHVARRTAGALWTLVGLLFPTLVAGAAFVEMVFGWPGAGSTLLRAVNGRDYPLVIALVLVGAIAVSVGSALADIGAARANPATRLES